MAAIIDTHTHASRQLEEYLISHSFLFVPSTWELDLSDLPGERTVISLLSFRCKNEVKELESAVAFCNKDNRKAKGTILTFLEREGFYLSSVAALAL